MAATSGQAGPIKPVVPCDRPVFVFGDATVLAVGVRAVGSTDFAGRLKSFLRRVCGHMSVETVGREGGHFLGDAATILDKLAVNQRSIALVHFPFADIESGPAVDTLLSAYRRLVNACTSTRSICIVGGQQPVNGFASAESDRQRELERRASAELGSSYLPLYRHFESESNSRRLIIPLDSGDGRLLNDQGHQVLFELYRRRLLELWRHDPAESSRNRGDPTRRRGS